MADTSNHKATAYRRRLMSFAALLLALAGIPAFAQTSVTNTASVTPPTGVTNPGTACAAVGSSFNSTTGACSASDVDTVTVPQLTLTKTASAPTFVGGVAASYTLSVRNSGTAATTAASTITDTIPTGLTIGTLPAGCTNAGQVVSCTIATGLAVGATTSFIIPVTPTRFAASSVVNTAVVSGGGDTTCPATPRCTSTVTTAVTGSADLAMAKVVNNPTPDIGNNVVFSLTINNIGPSDAVNAVVNDQLPAGYTYVSDTSAGQYNPSTGLWTIGLMVTGASANIQITARVNETGPYLNTAVASSATPDPVPANNTATATTTPVARPALELVKTANRTAVTAVGDVIAYSFSVRNTGNVTLTNVVVSDTLLTGLNCAAIVSLAPSATPTVVSCTGNTYTVSQADFDNNGGGDGDIDNTASARSTQTPTPVTSSVAVALPAANPVLQLVKAASPTAVTAAGNVITYSFNVRNAGNVTLTNVQVSDSLLTGLSCPAIASLAPSATPTAVSCTGNTYTVTQADLDNNGGGDGDIDNTARAVSVQTPTPVTSSVAVTLPARNPLLRLSKTAPAPTSNAAGGQINYDLVVTNDGNVTVSSLIIFDALLDSPAVCPVTTLAPQATTTCTGTLTLTQAIVDGGSVANYARAYGVAPEDVNSNDSLWVTFIPASASLALTKTASPTTVTAAGETVTYSFQVQNTGNVTLRTLAINETAFSGTGTVPAISCPVTTLAPTESTTCTGSYVVTQADVNAGTVTNTATATANTSTAVAVTSPTATATVTATAAPALTLVKTASPTTVTAAGATVTYSFQVQNTGNVTLTALAINETAFNGTGTAPAISCPVTTLAPSAATTCTGTYVVTQADINAGTVTNTATATASTPSGTITTPSATATVTATAAPALTVVKTAGTPTGNTAGSTINYNFAVTNTGNVTLTGIVINDAQLAVAAVCPVTTLAPAATTTCTGTHTITQTEVDAGQVVNSATAIGVPPVGLPVTSAPSTTTTPLTRTPALVLTKNGTPTAVTAVGQVITYTFAVQNTGNATFTSVTLSDPMLPSLVCQPRVNLAPGTGEPFICTGNTYTVTQADIDSNGGGDASLDNTATASGIAAGGGTATSSASFSVALPGPAPAIALSKLASPSNVTGVGSVITYSFSVQNPGNVSLDNLVLTDPLLPTLACSLPATLAPGADVALTCTGNTYTVTQNDLDTNGGGDNAIENTASISGDPPTGAAVNATDTAIVTLPTPAGTLILVKSAGTPSGNAAGSTLAYSFQVTNSGNVTLTGLVINDAQLDGPAVCLLTTLAPSASTTCTGTHTITQAEVNLGLVANSATATATQPIGGTVTSAPSTTTTTITRTASLLLSKTASPAAVTAVGDVITYSFSVRNAGNVTLTNVQVSDPLLTGLSCPAIASLEPSATPSVVSCTGNTYTVTQADIDSYGGGTPSGDGNIDNTASAVSVQTPTAVTSSAAVALPPRNAALTLVKTAPPPSSFTAGATINYNFVVTNTGNQSLTSLVIIDGPLDAPAVCLANALAPGATTTCTGIITITQAQVDAGEVINAASALAQTPLGTEVSSPTSVWTTDLPASPVLEFTKSANRATVTAVGDVISYSFSVRNAGNVSLTNVQVTDTLLTGLSCPAIASLAPSATPTVVSCTGNTYTVTQADIDSNGGGDGNIDNTASAVSVQTPTPVTSSVAVTLPARNPGLSVAKTAGTPTGNTAGSTLAYNFIVTNTGNVTLAGIAINDAQLDAAAVCPATTLAPQASTTCTGTHTITQAEVNSGAVLNSATASGTPSTGAAITSSPSNTNTPLARTPNLVLTKTATPTAVTAVGDVITYSFSVQNTGNVTLDTVTLADPMLTTLACPALTALAPGATAAFTCTAGNTYTVTQADVDNNGGGNGGPNGAINNTATATGTSAGGTAAANGSAAVTLPAANGALTVVKTAAAPTGNTAGSTIAYSFLVTNTGNVTLTAIAINDAQLNGVAICPLVTLAPSATVTCGGSHTITQAEVDAGTVSNTATVSGAQPDGAVVTSPDSSTTTTLTRTTSLVLTKTATPTAVTAVGDVITYSFSVQNTGNVTLDTVTLADPMLTTLACPALTALAPGATAAFACTAGNTYTVTQADIDNNGGGDGDIDNTATATGTAAAATAVSNASASVTLPVNAAALTVVKTAGTPTGNTAGSTLAYSFLVTNTGNVTLTAIAINDAQLDAAATCPATTLLPLATTTCTGTHTITQAEANAGLVLNSATASGTPPAGSALISPPSDTSTPIASAAGLTIDKTAGTPSGSTVGSTIAYSFLVTNTGNVTLSALVINDTQLDAAATCPVTVLAPGANTTCSGTHTITQAEVDAGVVDNSATATATPPAGLPIVSAADSTSTPIIGSPSETLTKVLTGNADGDADGAVSVGDVLTYTITMTNTGNTTLTNVVVNDSKIAPGSITCASVAPAASCVLVGTYTVLQSDADAGVISNTATVTNAICPPGSTDAGCTTTLNTVVAQASALTSAKLLTSNADGDGSGTVSLGDVLGYTVTVTNTGTVTLTDLTITDTKLTPNSAICAAVAPNATCVLTGNYTVTQVDVDAGSVVNTANVVTPKVLNLCPAGSAVALCNPTVTVPVVQLPAIAATKTATLSTDGGTPGVGNAGDVITYNVTVANTGNTTVGNLVVLDSFEGNAPTTLTCAPTTLAPGASVSCNSYTHTITEAEANAGGTLDNSVAATARTVGGNAVTVSATSAASVEVEADDVALRITKVAGVREVKIGDLVRYTLTVENTGSSNLVNGSIIDTPPAGFSFVEGSLQVADGDSSGTVSGQSPIRIEGLDVAGGGDRKSVV